MFQVFSVKSSDLIEVDGIVLAVRACNVDDFMQAKLDNSLLIESKLNKIRGASIEIDQIVKRADLDLVRM